MADVSSSEFIKGYTKIILCAYLYKGRNYLYAVIKQLWSHSDCLNLMCNRDHRH